ncbi:hypothetical protein HYV57_02905 [Candidatus Peregrinibacteria bacterium]|nr:hypothetical protein [Candidatus Peregrinibacteria bacterium]
MSTRVWKNDKESTERFFQRFNAQVQKSRVVLAAKDSMHFKKKSNKRRTRQAAKMRDFYRTERERKKFY